MSHKKAKKGTWQKALTQALTFSPMLHSHIKFNPDTESECRYVYQPPVGDACNLPEKIVKNNIQYQIDKEKSIPTNEAKDNDAVIYLVPID